MSKKLLIVLIPIVLLIAATTGVFLAARMGGEGDSETSLPETVKNIISPQKKVEELVYQDESGFSFKYYSDYKVTDITASADETYYSYLEVKNPTHTIEVEILDTNSKTAEQFLNTNKELTGAQLVGAATLGGLSAKQYSKDDNLVTIAIDQGVAYVINGENKSEKSEEAYNLFVDSFQIGQSRATPKAGSAPAEVIYEEEEVIE